MIQEPVTPTPETNVGPSKLSVLHNIEPVIVSLMDNNITAEDTETFIINAIGLANPNYKICVEEMVELRNKISHFFCSKKKTTSNNNYDRSTLVPMDNYSVISANIEGGVLNMSIDIENLFMIAIVIVVIIMVIMGINMLVGNGYNFNNYLR